MSDIETDTQSGNYCMKPVQILDYVLDNEISSEKVVEEPKHEEKLESSYEDTSHKSEDNESHISEDQGSNEKVNKYDRQEEDDEKEDKNGNYQKENKQKSEVKQKKKRNCCFCF